MIDLRKFHQWAGVLFLAFVAGSCSDEPRQDAADPPIPVAEAVDETNGTATSEPSTRSFDGIRFEIPAGWVPLPDSQFFDAKYTIPHEAGDMQLTLTGMGGGIEPNLERWEGQFEFPAGEAPQRETIEVAGQRASWLGLSGTFRNQMSATPGAQSNSRLIGVGIPLPERDFYLKLTGPAEAVADFEPEFREFLATAELTD